MGGQGAIGGAEAGAREMFVEQILDEAFMFPAGQKDA
jgi:hypothetical protein